MASDEEGNAEDCATPMKLDVKAKAKGYCI